MLKRFCVSGFEAPPPPPHEFRAGAILPDRRRASKAAAVPPGFEGKKLLQGFVTAFRDMYNEEALVEQGAKR